MYPEHLGAQLSKDLLPEQCGLLHLEIVASSKDTLSRQGRCSLTGCSPQAPVLIVSRNAQNAPGCSAQSAELRLQMLLLLSTEPGYELAVIFRCQLRRERGEIRRRLVTVGFDKKHLEQACPAPEMVLGISYFVLASLLSAFFILLH